MWRHSNGPLAQADDKPFTDFLAERCVMDVTDLNVSLLRVGSPLVKLRKQGSVG